MVTFDPVELMVMLPIPYLLLALVLLATGLLLMEVTRRDLSLTYPMLLVVSIVGSGLMPLGYSLVDEVLAGFVLLGGIGALLRRPRSQAAALDDRLDRVHLVLFLVMVAYFEFQAVRGLIVLESLRKLRWVAFFALVGLIPIVLRVAAVSRPSSRDIAKMVTASGLAYFSLYMLVGLGAELLDASRWSLQSTWWVPTAYASLPVLIAMPVVIYGFRQGRGWLRTAGWALLALMIASAFYYDSRIATLSLLGFLAVGYRSFGSRGIAAAGVLIALALVFIAPFVDPQTRLADTLQEAGELVKTVVTFVDPPDQYVPHRDMERYIHVQVAFASLEKDWRTALVGFGYRVHGRVISPELRAAYERYGALDMAARIREDESTEGFTALVVDTGLIGLGLFVANHLLVAWRVILQRHSPYRLPALLAVGLVFLWQFAISILDATLLFLLLMPWGPLRLLTEGKEGAPAWTPSQATAGLDGAGV